MFLREFKLNLLAKFMAVNFLCFLNRKKNRNFLCQHMNSKVMIFISTPSIFSKSFLWQNHTISFREIELATPEFYRYAGEVKIFF
jgi:hypothetical protein